MSAKIPRGGGGGGGGGGTFFSSKSTGIIVCSFVENYIGLKRVVKMHKSSVK